MRILRSKIKSPIQIMIESDQKIRLLSPLSDSSSILIHPDAINRYLTQNIGS